MKILGINSEKCINCGQCIADCPQKLYSEVDETNQIIFEDPYNICILCGHCLAICPTNAIIAEEIEDLYEFEEAKDPSKLLNYENLMKLLRARRSIRRFQDKPIPREQIEMILQAMRYAPSASNKQSWNYIVLTNREKIKIFADKVMELYYLLRKVLKLKFLLRFFVRGETRRLLLDPGTKIAIERTIADHKAGKDVMFYNAPCVIVLHSLQYGNMAGADAGIALTHGMLAAQSLGIGTCWIGLAQEAVFRKKKLRKWLGIPKGRNCFGVLALGFPDVKYYRAPPRNKLQVQWIE
ncbi:MAG: nitroreductase family protein [Candidatus Helarchaeota archaeon]